MLLHALGQLQGAQLPETFLFLLQHIVMLAQFACLDTGLLHAAGQADDKGTAIIDLPFSVLAHIISSPFTHCDIVLLYAAGQAGDKGTATIHLPFSVAACIMLVPFARLDTGHSQHTPPLLYCSTHHLSACNLL